nr:leucine-rich repeat domain-containing protein [Candidatus Sigynarchaeum springense]
MPSDDNNDVFRGVISAREADGLDSMIHILTVSVPPFNSRFSFQRRDPGYVAGTRFDAITPSIVIHEGKLIEMALDNAWHPELEPVMDAFPHLQVLQMRGWRPPVDDFGFLKRMPSLKTLILDASVIKENLDTITSARTLEVLRARNCGLRSFPEAVTRLPNLRVLDLADNPIGHEVVTPPREPKKPWFLKRECKRLDGTLRYDHGTTEAQRRAEHEAYRQAMEAWRAAMKAWVAPPPKVATALPDSIGELRGLEELRVARCGLTGLPGCIGNLSRLRVLDVSGNPLGVLPASMARLERLEVLHASGCGLSSLPDLSKAPLVHVDVNGNELTKLPGWLETWAFDNFSRTYDFSCNPLAEPPAFIELYREARRPPPPADDDDDFS